MLQLQLYCKLKLVKLSNISYSLLTVCKQNGDHCKGR